MMDETQHGHLLLADISGYTSYVASTELTHSQEILGELLECIIENFKALLTISKIEGDAVFAYAPESKISRAEAILELIEITYAAFRSRRDSAHRRTTCTCNACRNIPNLDLKFIAHHGDYFVQNISGINELIGSDVNLIHRLLKNHVSEKTGWKAYALFTEQSLRHLAAPPEGLFETQESYEHLGEVHTLSLDMHARYLEIMDAKHIVITPEEAHHIFEYEYHASPSVVWEWFNDPQKRGQWMMSDIIPIIRVQGRSRAAGARNHCVHGNNQVIVEDVLDIKPYDYMTVSHSPQGSKLAIWVTFRFQEIAENKTHFTLLFKGHMPLMPDWVKKQFCRYIVHSQILKMWKLEAIDSFINSPA